MIKIFAYNKHSRSARALAEEMGVYLIRHENSRYRPRTGHTVINWGRGRTWAPARTLNFPPFVERVINKLQFFRDMTPGGQDPDIPDNQLPRIPGWTTDIEVARGWARAGRRVVVRRLLNAHEGRGIEIHTNPEEIPQAPLYTKYVPKDGEYRIHIVCDAIIDIQKKVLRAEIDRGTANRQVRNTANGYVFARRNIQVPPDVQAQALLAMRASGLDFAAADVIWSERHQQAYVLELNTAPGLEGSTIKLYATALRNYIEDNQD